MRIGTCMTGNPTPDVKWRTRLYDAYVSTGQAASAVSSNSGLSIKNYPYFQRRVRPLLPTQPDSRMADLGCGHGALLYCLKQWGYRNVWGVDRSAEQVALAHSLGVAEVREGDLLQSLRTCAEPMDVIFLMDVIEHLPRGAIFTLLATVRAALADGGLLLLHTPNASGIFGMAVRYGDLTHEMAFTVRSVEQLLHAVGFEEIEFYEDTPVVHGFLSMVRCVVWTLGTAFLRLLYLAETGSPHIILSQNMLVAAKVRGRTSRQ